MAARALPDLIARIRVDSSGVDKSMANMVSSFGRANIAVAGLGAAIGLLIVGGKSMIDNTRAFEEAQLSLSQALGGSKDKLAAMQKAFDAWAETNKAYIPDQYAAETALAAFVRAGSKAKETMRLLNDALDISIIKHEGVTEAGNMLTLALAGNSRGLRFLGISTTDYNKIMKSHLTTAQKHAALLHLIEKKTKDGRKAQDDLNQSTNELNHNWQQISKEGGPKLVELQKNVLGIGVLTMELFQAMGHDNNLWSAIEDRLIAMASWIHDYIIKPIQDAYALINGGPDSRQGAANSAAAMAGRYGYGGAGNFATGQVGSAPRPKALALGGSVLPGNIYTVGEQGPETLVMGARGGMVIPNRGSGPGGGGNVYITVMGHVQTERNLQLAMREGLRRLDRQQS
jgi:hypothetical protein